MNNSPSFFAELKRRNVYRVAITYGVVAWLLIQAASILLPTFDAPAWVMKALVVFLALGFVLSVMISWAFEATPEGLKRTEDISPEAAAKLPTWSRKKFIAFVGVVALFAVGLLTYQVFRPGSRLEGGAPATPNDDGVAGARPSIPDKSIAVLPFDNLSDDKSNAYFAEGVQDEILTRLAKVADLKVISRTSTQRFKSAPSDLREIARQLGVVHVVEGSVQKAGDQVRVNVQLINALTDAHLWAETYDHKLTDIFAVESEIAKTIADTLQAKLSGAEKTSLSKKPTVDPEAYELYLKGRFFWNKRGAEGLRRSIEYLQQAIEKDPTYALAYAGLAQAWMVLPAYNGGAPVECGPKAEAAARKALSLDDALSDAVAVLASKKSEYDFDYPGARAEFERAIQLNPNDATARHWFATDYLASTGDHAGELAQMKRASELDPLSLVLTTNLGNAFMHNNRLEEAIAQFRRAIEMDPSFYFAQWSFGQALELQGKMPEAIAQYEKAASLTSDPVPMGILGRAYGLTGRKADAQKILAKLRELRAQRFTPAYALALVCVGLQDPEQAIHWLEESYRERDGNNATFIRIDPLLASLHGNPRFEALAEKIVPARQFKKVIAEK